MDRSETWRFVHGMSIYDLIVIGGGAGAFAAAIHADELGKKTAIINDGLPLGGTCVNVGCVPSKRLLFAGEVLHGARDHDVPGIELEVKDFDFQRVIRDELSLVEHMRREKYEKVLGFLPHVTLIEGRARFTGGERVRVGSRTLGAGKFIIATGSTASVPPIDGINQAGYVTHIEALKMTEQPEEMVIIGSGPVGLEFAQMYSRFGTRVTVLEALPAVLPHAETIVVDRLLKALRGEGITIRTGVEITGAHHEGDRKIIEYTVDGERSKSVCDVIMIAAGKRANTGGLGLDLVNVEVGDNGAITVDQYLRTSNSRIYAVGDVTDSPLRLETTAGREGTLAAGNALAGRQDGIDYATVPYAIFTDPQLASVGYSEAGQMKELGVCSCRSVPLTAVPKAGIINRTEGLIKMNIHPETEEIMGVHILAPNASELIAAAMVLVKNRNTIHDVIDSLPLFPTLSEAIKLVALSFTRDIEHLSCCI